MDNNKLYTIKNRNSMRTALTVPKINYFFSDYIDVC